MIYYIHGYNSSVNSETFKALQKEFPDAVALTYDVNEPGESITKLVGIVNRDRCPTIVGSSLGGWYADQLTKFILGDFILYNPCTNPSEALAKYGLPQETLDKYKLSNSHVMNSRTIFLCTDDDVVPHERAQTLYEGIADIKYTTGGHRMTAENMEKIIEAINYLRNQLC